jgi:hypothetical protein
MVLIMSKYIPKVGEAFEWERFRHEWKKENAVVFETEKQIAFINCKGLMEVMSKNINFRPTQTESDVEREQLGNLIYAYRTHMGGDTAMLINEIIKAGFTIPKKVNRSDIENTILAKFCNSHVIRCYLVTAICELLGDLVEQDKGGAE